MALKNWILNHDSQNLIEYIKKKNDKIIDNISIDKRGRYWWIENMLHSRDRKFSHKVNALKFAKQYMRTH